MNILVSLLAVVLLTGCSPTDETSEPTPTNNANNVTHTNNATSNNWNSSDSGTDSGTDSGINSGTDTGSETDSGTDADPTSEIWSPRPGTTWVWQLSGTLDTSVDADVYDVDLVETSDQIMQKLRADGRIIICYFSAGTREDYRADADAFPQTAVGKALPEWPDEQWLDIRDTTVRQVMLTRMDLAQQRGCDAVEPDNVDAYINDSGFPLTQSDQLDYLRFLATEAHQRGLSIGLKNAVELVPDLVDEFDWTLNEECLAYNECDAVQPFIDAGKAVFHVEYVDNYDQGATLQNTVCANPTRAGFSTLIKVWDLDAWFLTCP